MRGHAVLHQEEKEGGEALSCMLVCFNVSVLTVLQKALSVLVCNSTGGWWGKCDAKGVSSPAGQLQGSMYVSLLSIDFVCFFVQLNWCLYAIFQEKPEPIHTRGSVPFHSKHLICSSLKYLKYLPRMYFADF